MLHNALGIGTSDSFSETTNGRPSSPLCSTEECYKRLKKHATLSELVDKTFKASEDAIDKFEQMNSNYDSLGKWCLTNDVDAKMDNFKETLANSQTSDYEDFWNLIQADVIVAAQQTKMNEILLKTNAELKCQLALAKEVFSKTQTDAVATLRDVVKDSLELLQSREEEAGHWKTMHHEATKKCEGVQKDLKVLQRRMDDTQAQLGTAEQECRRLKLNQEKSEELVKEYDSRVKRLEQELQETRRKNQLLKGAVDQKTDEVASLDTDLRASVKDIEQLKEKHKKDLERFNHNFEVKMNEELDKQEKQIKETHNKEMDHMHNEYRKLENERGMLYKKVEEYKAALEEAHYKNDYLNRNSKKIKQDLLAQCQRRVFTALNYDTHSQSSDSPPAVPPIRRSRSVAFQNENHNRPVERLVQPPQPTEPLVQPVQQKQPVRSGAILATTNQVRQRAPTFTRRT